jgi:hypothetical protein
VAVAPYCIKRRTKLIFIGNKNISESSTRSYPVMMAWIILTVHALQCQGRQCCKSDSLCNITFSIHNESVDIRGFYLVGTRLWLSDATSRAAADVMSWPQETLRFHRAGRQSKLQLSPHALSRGLAWRVDMHRNARPGSFDLDRLHPTHLVAVLLFPDLSPILLP